MTYLPLVSGGDDSSGALANSRGNLREDRLDVGSKYHGYQKTVNETYRDVWCDDCVYVLKGM